MGRIKRFLILASGIYTGVVLVVVIFIIPAAAMVLLLSVLLARFAMPFVESSGAMMLSVDIAMLARLVFIAMLTGYATMKIVDKVVRVADKRTSKRIGWHQAGIK